MKQGRFSALAFFKAMAIVNIFETGKPFGDFAACVVLNDGAGISYGINQFTHRSGSLAGVIERYLEIGGAAGRLVLEGALVHLRRREPAIVRSLARDERLKEALRAAALTSEMRLAQVEVAFERYLKPAVDECTRLGFDLPLSLAVVYDGKVHGSYERFRDNVRVAPLGVPTSVRTAEAVALTFEKAWITEYVRQRDRWLRSVPRLRTTSYRTKFFLDQIKVGRWKLELPLNVHGLRLGDRHIRDLAAYADPFFLNIENPPVTTGGSDTSAVGPYLYPQKTKADSQTPPDDPHDPASTPQAQPPSVSHPQPENCTLQRLDDLETNLNCSAAKFDQVDRIVTGVVARTDRAKSLWTTVAGTLWQTAWALFGFIAGVPREVWIVVAVIAALLMLLYLYRQIALGKIRERSGYTAQTKAS